MTSPPRRACASAPAAAPADPAPPNPASADAQPSIPAPAIPAPAAPAPSGPAPRLPERPLTSLSYLQSLYCDPEEDKKIRFEAAKAALPYEHVRESGGDESRSGPPKVTVLDYIEYLKLKAAAGT